MARLDELEQKFEENPRRYFAPLANEYRKAGDPQRAAELCRSQLPEIPGHISGHIVLGQALYDSRDFEGARAALETALALDPENIVALRYLGDIARDTGDFPEADRWYSRTLEADPYNEAATAALQSVREAAPLSAPVPAAEEPIPERSDATADVSAAADFEPTSLAAESEPVDAEPAPAISGEDVQLVEPDPVSAGEDLPSAGAFAEPQEFAGDLEISAAEPAETAEPVETAEPAETAEPVETAEPAMEPFDVAAHALPEPVTVEELIQAEERVMENAAPFVTETMADLYLEQGYPHEALELLLQLSEQRPHDESLRGKIEHIESVIVARRDAAVAAARAERAEAAEAAEPPLPSQGESEDVAPAPFDAAVAQVDASAFAETESQSEGPELEAASALESAPGFEAASESESPVEPRHTAPRSVREMFAQMDRARPRAAGAVTPRPLARLRSDFVPLPEAQDAQESPSDDPFAFPDAPAAAGQQPNAVPRSSGPQPRFDPSTAQIEDFDAWLRGLRGP